MRAVIVSVWTVNLVLVAITIVGFFVSDAGYDWLIFVEAGRRVGQGSLYEWGGIYAYSYSPLLAYLFIVLPSIGFVGWSLLHVAALGFLRDGRITLIAALAWPFWADVYNGNTMTFVFVAAFAALQRRPGATAAFLALSLLMPRPLMLPMVAWILWKQPAWRARFALMIVLNGVLILATGYAAAWVESLLGVSQAVTVSTRDVGPGVLIGVWWLVLGAALSIVLVVRGHMGFASLATSPYWLPQYLLMLLLELSPNRSPVSATTRTGEPGFPSASSGRSPWTAASDDAGAANAASQSPS